mmetsp:Transcript_43654/g.87375  ORF Transcript_43654/g.87375 Transcript_43654/m.87375 type:complete len:97 (-) Transcript_43654:276-566(-)
MLPLSPCSPTADPTETMGQGPYIREQPVNFDLVNFDLDNCKELGGLRKLCQMSVRVCTLEQSVHPSDQPDCAAEILVVCVPVERFLSEVCTAELVG